VEILQQDGHPCSPNSLFNIVAGSQRHLRSLPVFGDIAFFEVVAFRTTAKGNRLPHELAHGLSSVIGVSTKRVIQCPWTTKLHRLQKSSCFNCCF